MSERVHSTIYYGYVKFFRIRLLALSPDQIADLVDGLEKDVKNIKTESLKLAWYMRGGLSYTESMGLSTEERAIISAIIKENLETTKKTKMPFY